jgi:hypothetical protein
MEDSVSLRPRVATLVLLAAMLSLSWGCTKKFIPNTALEDTPENWEVVRFCERYRHAIEDLNVGLLLSLASPRYFDNSGSSTGDDDYDYSGLERILTERFKDVEAMRYEIKYRDIYEQDGLTMVDYTYTLSFQYRVGDKSQWANKTADNRLELERVEDGFLIVAGM